MALGLEVPPRLGPAFATPRVLVCQHPRRHSRSRLESGYPRIHLMISLLALAGIAAGLSNPGGYFTVAWPNGNAAFDSPLGSVLWSYGVDCVETGTDAKDYKPANKSYAAYRLFVSDREWVQDTIAKLESWGFNSTGGWSDDDLFKKYAPASRLPYFVVLHLGAWDQAPWHDLFDKEMTHWVNVAARRQIPPIANDPKLVGYFSDNELGWWDDTLFLSYLKMKRSAPGRERLIETLRGFYNSDFSRLKADWIVDGTSFDQIVGLHLRPGGSGRNAIDVWTEVLGRRYYSLMRDTIRRYDRHHLILGDRYCQYYTLPIARAARDYVDVISTKFGADWNNGAFAPFFLRTLHQVTGKPVIVTEFYMAATYNRSGNKNSGTAFPVVLTQADRAASFSRYVKAVASLPYSIGAHWFQFTDEPEKGRGDGEDFNMGLVDTSGRPYEEMVTASRALDLASLRAHARDPVPAHSMVVPEMPAGTALHGIQHWPLSQSELPVSAGTPFGDVFAVRDSGALYLALFAMDYMDEGLYLGGHVPEIDRDRWRIRLTGLAPTIDIRFGGKGQRASMNPPGFGIQEIGGLKQTLVVQIPLRDLARARQIHLSSTLDSHGRSSTMRWDADLLLDAAAASRSGALKPMAERHAR